MIAVASQRIKNFLKKDKLETIAKNFLNFTGETNLDPQRISYSETFFSARLKTQSLKQEFLVPFDFIRLFVAAKNEVSVFFDHLKKGELRLDDFIFYTKRFLSNQRMPLTKNDIALLKVCVDPNKIITTPGKFTQDAQSIKKYMNCSLATVYNSLNKLKTLGIFENKLYINYRNFNLELLLVRSTAPIDSISTIIEAGESTHKHHFAIALTSPNSTISKEITSQQINFLHENWNFDLYRSRNDPLLPIYPKKELETLNFEQGLRISTKTTSEQIKFDFIDLQIIDLINDNQELTSISTKLNIDEKEIGQRIFNLFSKNLVCLYPSFSMIGLPAKIYYYIQGSKEKILQFKAFLRQFIHYCIFSGDNFIFGISQVPMSWLHQLWDIFELESSKFDHMDFGILTGEQIYNRLQFSALWDKEKIRWKKLYITSGSPIN